MKFILTVIVLSYIKNHFRATLNDQIQLKTLYQNILCSLIYRLIDACYTFSIQDICFINFFKRLPDLRIIYFSILYLTRWIISNV